ncbi:MAG: phosphoribosylformylglycinamidine cyclo-ligase [Candidatus Zixiibacteriota bacterium]
MTNGKKETKITYADSGVNVKAGEEAVEKIKQMAASTFNSQVLTGLGAFGGFFKPDLSAYKEPVFISSTDSVGTKLKLAFMTKRHNTVGEDLVNHCINDILVHGATPLFFLDYIALPKVKPQIVSEIVEGLARGCKNGGAALIGGETAELPDFYQPDEYDLVGFVVGVVEQSNIINGTAIKEGDICLGLPSSGLHTNGYTLARKVAFEIASLKPDDYIDELQMTIAEALIQVHRCYAPIVYPLLDKFNIHGMAHITGGGIPGNLIRIMPEGLKAEIDKSSWQGLPIFEYLKKIGNIDPDDIYSAFNMGIGYILVVDKKDADDIISALTSINEKVYPIGSINKGKRAVNLV